MAELLLSAFLEVLFDRLASPELLKFARREGLQKQLDKWGKTMERIREVLDDAEEKQQTKKTVKAWLDDLRDLAYDVEDILDEVVTEAALQRKLMAPESQASASMVRNLVPACCTSLTPSAVKIKFRLGSKIEKINTRFNDLVAQKDKLDLLKNSSMRPSKRREIRPPSTSLVTEDRTYGREEVREAVLQLLVSDKHSDASNKVPNVIPIVGMGGIGKTTLAQLVYNDKKVESFFNLKAWACVSEDFDVAAVTKTILQSLTSENCDGKDLNWLQVKLKEKLHGKRFLVILDDVWNENYNDWTLLRAPFEAGAPGSSIIVTTRIQEVSKQMQNKEVEPFQLKELSDEACLSIFTQHALDARDFSAHPNLKDIGEELVRRCKGLPLAVKTIAGVLRSEDEDRKEWEKVLKNKIWNIPVEKSGIHSSLMVSYDNLPSHLKRCFAYCSILPKDYEFEEKEVVLLWMAEGLIQPPEEKMEDLGSKYFHRLLSRSFFQKSCINESKFVMHDLINDLAQLVAADTCYRMEAERIGNCQNGDIPIKPRHSSYLGSQYDVTKKFEVFSKFTSLRTFLPLMLPDPGYCYLAHHVHFELIPTLRCLRVLSFNGYCITELSDSIGDLKHLRYLDLSRTKIRLLPESITGLYNLQTLLLKNCFCLKKLPSRLCNLVNLRHLNIEGANSLEGMPMQIGKLTCLQTLSNLVLEKDSCFGIKELGPLKHLKGTLCISRLENVIEPKDAKDAKLIEKTKIDALSLEWSRDIDESKDRTSELEVLNGLRPHNALMKLVIINYGGTKFPNWLTTSPSFPGMVSLRLESWYKCTSLPPLGQYLPSLKNLFIRGMANVKSVGSEFCGGNLETLHFDDMKEWENWSPCEEFPNLRVLSLYRCPKLLGKLPNNLPLLNKVEISDCAQLVVSISCFPDKCKFNIRKYKGVVCESKVTFKLIKFFRSLSPISDEVLDIEGLERLTIDSCEELTNLWSDNKGEPLPHDLPILKFLRINNCPKLVSLVAEEVDQERLQLGITSFAIRDCIALESLPKALMYNNTCLQYIHINRCDSLTHFARSHLPPTLKKLSIGYCKSMRNLVEDDDNDTNNNSTTCSSGFTSLLEELDVWNCPSLESLTSSGELPATLQHLRIYNCPKLESVAKSFHHNSFLTTISIHYCENLQLLLLPSNLRELYIYDCKKMQGLQNDIHNLTSFRDLKIRNCPRILSFPKEGFPTSLTTLEISELKITEDLFDWGLDNLTSLNELDIGGCQNLVSFPEMTLPASLTSLRILYFSNLECLSSEGLRKLTSLKTLQISYCEKLTCFPKDGLPPSLLELDISHCQKFMSLPKNGLPPSVQKVEIGQCPLLEERCKKDQRGEWRKIADIPRVEINGKYLHEIEAEE